MVVACKVKILNADKSDTISIDGKKDLTVGYACADALYCDYANNPVAFDEKISRAKLAEKFLEQPEVELDVNEFETLKKCLALRYSPLVLLQVIRSIK